MVGEARADEEPEGGTEDPEFDLLKTGILAETGILPLVDRPHRESDDRSRHHPEHPPFEGRHPVCFGGGIGGSGALKLPGWTQPKGTALPLEGAREDQDGEQEGGAHTPNLTSPPVFGTQAVTPYPR